MNNVINAMSKFKTNLGNFIDEYKNELEHIEKEEEFIRTLSDVINYSKNDILLLPFYDQTILSRIFERISPLSSNEMNKIKTAKYLIEASKSVDKSHFLQYNNAVKDIKNIFDNINSYYEKMLADETLKTNKEKYSSIVENYEIIYNKIGEDSFKSIIDDVDLFEETITNCKLENEDISTILNIAIKDNLKYLDTAGISIEKKDNKSQDEIYDLSHLLREE